MTKRLKCARRLKAAAGYCRNSCDLGAALWNRGRVDESILHSRKALELDPNLIDPRLNLGVALLAKGNYDEAIAHLEYVLRLNPQHEVAQKLLNAAQQKRDGAATQP